MAKLSVVVPVYNVEKYLERCLKALENQSMRDIEIICVDDGSKDGSRKILDRHAKKDKRFKVVSKKNGGLSDARNAGMAAVSTDYIMFCDSDDWYDSKMCDMMYRAITESRADLAICGTNVIYEAQHHMRESDDNYYRIKYTGKRALTEKVAFNTDVAVWNKIYRKRIIDKYKISFPVGRQYEDAYFSNAYMAASRNIYYVGDKLYNYVRRDGSIMSGTFEGDPKAMDHLYIAFDLYDFLTRNNLYDHYQRIFWNEFLEYYWFAHEWVPKKMRAKVKLVGRQFVRKHLREIKELDKDVAWRLKGMGSLAHKASRIPKRILQRISLEVMPSYRKSRYLLDVEKGIMRELDEIESRINRLSEK